MLDTEREALAAKLGMLTVEWNDIARTSGYEDEIRAQGIAKGLEMAMCLARGEDFGV